MAWNEDEYVDKAKSIASEHLCSKAPLNDLLEKAAHAYALNPNEIRTLGRITNVATFQEMFKVKEASRDPDRLIEYEVADPEVVISRMQKSGGDTHADVPVATASSFTFPDEMKDLRYGKISSVKTAAVKVPEKLVSREKVILNLRKVANELDIERTIYGNRWETITLKLAEEFRKVGTHRYDIFEKDCLALHGIECGPELTVIRENLKIAGMIPYSKIAEYREFHVVSNSSLHKQMDEAMAARASFVKVSNGAAYAKAQLKGVSI